MLRASSNVSARRTAKFAFEEAGQGTVATKVWPRETWPDRQWTTSLLGRFGPIEYPTTNHAYTNHEEVYDFRKEFEDRYQNFGDFQLDNHRKTGKWTPIHGENEGLTIWCDELGGWEILGDIRQVDTWPSSYTWKVQFGHVEGDDLSTFTSYAMHEGFPIQLNQSLRGITSAHGADDPAIIKYYPAINAVRATLESEGRCPDNTLTILILLPLIIILIPFFFLGLALGGIIALVVHN